MLGRLTGSEVKSTVAISVLEGQRIWELLSPSKCKLQDKKDQATAPVQGQRLGRSLENHWHEAVIEG